MVRYYTTTPLSQTIYMNKANLICLILCFTTGLIAQTPSELMTKYSDEDVVRLQNRNETHINLVDDKILITKKYALQTFLNDKNLNGLGDVALKYEPPFSEVVDVNAYTLVPNLEKDKYRKEKVRDIEDQKIIDEDVFHDGTRAKVFKFKGMMHGAITVLEYEEELHEPFLVGREVFDPYVFTESQHFTLSVEDGIEVEYQYFNCDSSFFDHWTEKKKGKTFYHWRITAMDSRKFEPGSPNWIYLSPHIVYRIKSFKDSKGQEEKVLGTVSDLHQYYQGFLANLEKPNEELISLTDSLVKGLSSPREKAKAIYDWVNASIRYIAFEDGYGGFRPREANFVCTKRYGDCKDMSNLMVQMMTHVGLDAYHVWIGTRDIPYTYEEVPTGLSDNHMIAALKLDGETIFLDATNKMLPFGYPSSFTQGKQALINLGPDAFELMQVPVLKPEENNEIDSCLLRLEGANLRGEGNKHFGVYRRARLMRVLERKDEEALKDWVKYDLEKGDNRCKSKLGDYTITDDGLDLNYTMELDKFARIVGDKIIVNLNLEPIIAGSGTEDDRESPLELINTTQLKRHFALEIPEGYKVDYIPNSSNYEHPKFDYQLEYQEVDGKILYDLEIQLKAIFIDKEELADWNEFIRALRKNYQQTVILIPDENN